MDSKILQIRMREQTISQVDNLKEKIQAPSRSDAIRRAIELSDTLTQAAKHGHRIIIEDTRGEKRQVIIPGLQSEQPELNNE